MYSEFSLKRDGILSILISLTGVGLIVLILIAIIEDIVKIHHSYQEGDKIEGRCETCGKLSHNIHNIHISSINREVSVCTAGVFYIEHNDYHNIAIQAINTPMWFKRISR